MPSALKRNILYISLLQFSNYIIPFFIEPYIRQTIQVEYAGLVDNALFISWFFIAIVNFGFDFSATRLASLERDNLDKLQSLYSTIFWSKGVLFVVSMLFFFGVFTFYPRAQEYPLLYWSAFAISIGHIFIPWWFFQGLEKMFVFSVGNFLIKLISVVLMLIVVREKEDFELYVVTIAASNVLIGIIFFFYAKLKFQFQLLRPKLNNILKVCKESIFTFANEFAVLFVTHTGVVMAGIFIANDAVIGAYSTAYKLIIVLNAILLVPFQKSYFPHIVPFAQTDPLQFIRKLRKVQIYVLSFLAFVGVCLFFGADLVVTLLYGDTFVSSIAVLQVLALIPIFTGLANIYGWQGLLPARMDNKLFIITLTVGIINIFAHIILRDLLNEQLLAWLRVGAELLLGVACFITFELFYVRKFAK